jgi:hypothetical protein
MAGQPDDDPAPDGASLPGFGLPGLLAAFERGGAWDAAAPSAALAAALEAAAGPQGHYDGAETGSLVGITRQWAAIESWAAAGTMAALRAMTREDAEGRPLTRRRASLPDGWSDNLNYEIAGALAMGPVSAGNLAGLAWTLGLRLPGIGRLLAAGALTKAKAKLIAQTFEPLDEGEAARAEALIIGEVPGKTWYQVQRLAWQAAIAIAPDVAERRRTAAERNRARVTVFKEESGAVGLSGRDLPAAPALSAHANLLARAAAYQASGAFGGQTGGALEALAYLHLLNGVSAQDAIAFARAATAEPPDNAGHDEDDDYDHDDPFGQAGGPAPGPDDDDDDGPDDDGGGSGGPSPDDGSGPDAGHDDDYDDDAFGEAEGDDRAPGDSHGCGHGHDEDDEGPDDDDGLNDSSPNDGDDGPDGDDDGRGNGVDPDDDDGPNDGGGDPDDDAPARGPGHDGDDGGAGGPTVLPEVTAPLATLQRRAERPGENRLLGPLDPALTRDLAAAAARSPYARWEVTIVDDRGYAIGHGTARPARRRPHQPKPQPPPGPGWCSLPARVNITVTQILLRQLAAQAAQPRPGAPPPDWQLAPRTPGAADGTWALTLPGGRQLTLRFDVVPTHACDHRYEVGSYQPSERLRRLVQVRDHECTFPTCSRPASQSDFEHAVPYHKGGKTDACNAGARSRRCHQVKQMAGWQVSQPRPGWHQWTTPTGRTYVQEPWRYTA